jgi:MFS superfamily sulfate permease-like transporter
MPAPMLPDVHLLPVLMPSALSIAVVVVAVHISLAKMFAKKEGYEVDPGQVPHKNAFTITHDQF